MQEKAVILVDVDDGVDPRGGRLHRRFPLFRPAVGACAARGGVRDAFAVGDGDGGLVPDDGGRGGAAGWELEDIGAAFGAKVAEEVEVVGVELIGGAVAGGEGGEEGGHRGGSGLWAGSDCPKRLCRLRGDWPASRALGSWEYDATRLSVHGFFFFFFAWVLFKYRVFGTGPFQM